MNIIDCILFNNELDILELRLNELDQVVDKFVIIQADLTHTGNKKPLYLTEEVIDKKFSSFKDKIHIYNIDLSKFDKAWDRENYQRNVIQEIIEDYSYLHDPNDPNSIVLISDCDEIPNRRIVLNSSKILDKEKIDAFVFKQFFYYYNFKQGKREQCHGTIALRKSSFNNKKITPQSLRDNRFYLPYIQNAGWHLSFFGTPEQIQYKVKSFAHTEFSDKATLENITEKINSGKDLFGRESKFEELVPMNFPLPFYVEENRNLFIKWL